MEKPNDNNTPKKFNLNSYWIYGIIILIILIVNISVLVSNKREPITFGKFEELARNGEVEKVEVINKNDVEVYLKEEAIRKNES